MEKVTFLKQYEIPAEPGDERVETIAKKEKIIESSNAVVFKDEEVDSKDILNMEQDVIYSRDELSERGIIHQAMGEKVIANAFRNLRTLLLKKMATKQVASNLR